MSLKSPQMKQIALQFIVSEKDSAIIRKWINQSVINRTLRIDQIDDANIKEMRSDVRVELLNVDTLLITDPTANLPQQNIRCVLNDLSAGGACISIDANHQIAKGGAFRLQLFFIEENFFARGHIVGLRKN